MRTGFGLLALVAVTGVANAGLTDVFVDTTPGNAIVTAGNAFSPYGYAGAGTGFGGTLGNGGIFMDSDGSNLGIGFLNGGNLDNLVTIFLDTRAGGFVDADMDDQGDGGRRAASQLANATNDPMPAGFLPDFAVIIGSFGTVVFELNAGNSAFHLNFVAPFFPDTNLPRAINIPLATLGVAPGGNVDFFAAYTSDSGYLSNESVPANPALQANGNPGFGDGQFGGTVGSPGFANFNRFVTVPTPGALALAGVGGLLAARRRRA